MSSKKMLTAINIICFIIFVLIQSLIFFLRIIDYSLDDSERRNERYTVIYRAISFNKPYIFDTASVYYIARQQAKEQARQFFKNN